MITVIKKEDHALMSIKNRPGCYAVVDLDMVDEILSHAKSLTAHKKSNHIRFHSIRLSRTLLLYQVVYGNIRLGNKLHLDHKDRDPFNNRKDNLRVADYAKNSMNSTKRKDTSSLFKGVSWLRRKERWQSKIEYNKKSYTNLFTSEVDAALAYNKKARLLFKEFACLNILPEVIEL